MVTGQKSAGYVLNNDKQKNVIMRMSIAILAPKDVSVVVSLIG